MTTRNRRARNQGATYVPGFVWIRDDLTSYGEEHYMLASFRGVGLLLLRDDENVRWSLLEMNGR